METAVEQRVDRLEDIFGQFVTQTNRALLRMERGIETLQQEMIMFKNEMNGFKDRMESEVKRFNTKWGELANKMGTIVEDIVAPAIPRIGGEYFGCDEIEDFMVRRCYGKKILGKESHLC